MCPYSPGEKRIPSLEGFRQNRALLLIRPVLKEAREQVWLTGGSLRDLLLGRQPSDIDLITAGKPGALARRFADAIGGSYFSLSEKFKTARVLSPDGTFTCDFTALRGGSIKADLKLRDFTINAMAANLDSPQMLIDPLSGAADLKASRIRAVSKTIFDSDPLRLIRAVRLEKELGFSMSPPTAALVKQKAHLAAQPSGERIFAEFARLFEAPGAAAQVRRLDELALLDVLLPELSALKGISQNDYHHLDVFGHTLANCEALDLVIKDTPAFFPDQAEKLDARRRRRFAGDASWGFIMSFSSLMHDIAKPYCRFIDKDGQVRFFEHDRRGAEMASAVLSRLKASNEARRAVSFLVKKHMRFEGLLQQPVPSDRARLRYLRATEPLSPEAIMLSVSDRLSVRGKLVTEADVKKHLALAREIMAAAFNESEAPPRPKLIDGNDILKEFSLKPGPRVGLVLDHVNEEQSLGNLRSRSEALDEARRFLAELGKGQERK